MRITSYPPELLYGDETRKRLISYVNPYLYDTSSLAVMFTTKSLIFKGDGASPSSEVEILVGTSEADAVKVKSVSSDDSGSFSFSLNLQLGPNFIVLVNGDKTFSFHLNAYHWLLFITIFAEEFRELWNNLKRIAADYYLNGYDDLPPSFKGLYLNFGYYGPEVRIPTGWTYEQYCQLIAALRNMWWEAGTIKTLREVVYAITGVLPNVNVSSTYEISNLIAAKNATESALNTVGDMQDLIAEGRYSEARQLVDVLIVYTTAIKNALFYQEKESAFIGSEGQDTVYQTPLYYRLDDIISRTENLRGDVSDDFFAQSLSVLEGDFQSLKSFLEARITAASDHNSKFVESYRCRFADGYLGGRLYVDSPPSLNWYITPHNFVWEGLTGDDYRWRRIRYTSGTVPPNSITYVYIDGEKYESDGDYGYTIVKTSSTPLPSNYYVIGKIVSSTTAIVGFDGQRRPGQGMYLMSWDMWEHTFVISINGVNLSDEIVTLLIEVLREGKPATKLFALYNNGVFKGIG